MVIRMDPLVRTLVFATITFLLVNTFLYAAANPEIQPVSPLEPVDDVTNEDGFDVKSPAHDSNLGKANNLHSGVSNTFLRGFIVTLSVILVSELGDNTFFIGKILAPMNSSFLCVDKYNFFVLDFSSIGSESTIF
jgi:hypothetical protein